MCFFTIKNKDNFKYKIDDRLLMDNKGNISLDFNSKTVKDEIKKRIEECSKIKL